LGDDGEMVGLALFASRIVSVENGNGGVDDYVIDFQRGGSFLVLPLQKRAIFYSVFVIVVVDRGCLVIGEHLELFSVVIFNGCNLFHVD